MMILQGEDGVRLRNRDRQRRREERRHYIKSREKLRTNDEKGKDGKSRTEGKQDPDWR